MSQDKTGKGSQIRDYFAAEIKNSMEKQKVSAPPHAVDYVVDLLTRYHDSETFFAKDAEGKFKNETLAELYADYVQGTPEQKRATLRRLGDVCLVVTGFFPDSLNKKIVDVDYYMGMGGTAYKNLSQMQLTSLAAHLYQELSVKFKAFSEVLGELSERSGINKDSDVLRLYERWLMTGSERLRQQLSTHGIQTPVQFDKKTRH